MSQVWFTADTHFGHANIIKYCQRPFLSESELELLSSDPRGRWEVSADTVERHDTALLEAINLRLTKHDTLWVLGDFCWGKESVAKCYLDRIMCKNVNFVWGNHDHRSIGPLFKKTIEQGMISVEGQKIWVNHYPMRSWDGRFHGAWQLYGHVHDRLTAEDQKNKSLLTKDVGVDACDYKPISFEELREYMTPRTVEFEAAKARFIAGESREGESVD
ncbi:MAG: metallophosphoesterase [Mariniblastus sp.]